MRAILIPGEPARPRKRGYLWPAIGDGRWLKKGPRRSLWSKQGTISIYDMLEQDMTEEIARHVSSHGLHYYPQVRCIDKAGHAIAAAELRRREAWPARMALIISAIALIIAFGTLVLTIRRDMLPTRERDMSDHNTRTDSPTKPPRNPGTNPNARPAPKPQQAPRPPAR